MNMVNRIARFLGTGFYSGYFPKAPGTIGSAVALLLYLFFSWFRGSSLLIGAGLFFLIGLWASALIEKEVGHDAPIINIDEIVGMWLTLLFLPPELPLYWLGVAFLLFRFFDIVKPFPVGWSQKLPSGWGVMMDDVLAGVYANVILRICIYIFLS